MVVHGAQRHGKHHSPKLPVVFRGATKVLQLMVTILQVSWVWHSGRLHIETGMLPILPSVLQHRVIATNPFVLRFHNMQVYHRHGYMQTSEAEHPVCMCAHVSPVYCSCCLAALHDV